MGKSVQIGNYAPNFIGMATYKDKIGPIHLHDCLGKKNVVLIFYPFNFISFAADELWRVNFCVDDFRSLDTQIFAISIENIFSQLHFTKILKRRKKIKYFTYPLISDSNHKISKIYKTLTQEGFSLPCIFIIDKFGVVQYHTIYNMACRINIKEIYKILKLLQHSKK